MSPRLPMDDAPYRGLRDAVTRREFGLIDTVGVSVSDGCDIPRGQLCVGRVLTDGSPSLTSHVVHVLGVGAEKQMIGADTTPVITRMADHHAIGDRPMVHLPRKAVNVCDTASSKRDDTVATGTAQSASPQPASIRLHDEFPEPFVQWLDDTLRGHRSLIPSMSCRGCVSTARPLYVGDGEAESNRRSASAVCTPGSIHPLSAVGLAESRIPTSDPRRCAAFPRPQANFTMIGGAS